MNLPTHYHAVNLIFDNCSIKMHMFFPICNIIEILNETAFYFMIEKQSIFPTIFIKLQKDTHLL